MFALQKPPSPGGAVFASLRERDSVWLCRHLTSKGLDIWQGDQDSSTGCSLRTQQPLISLSAFCAVLLEPSAWQTSANRAKEGLNKSFSSAQPMQSQVDLCATWQVESPSSQMQNKDTRKPMGTFGFKQLNSFRHKGITAHSYPF